MNDNNFEIAARLRSPPNRANRRISTAGLVRQNYDDITAVRMKGRREGKTWDEIGWDLCPSDPIPGGTVGRAYSRVSAEREAAVQPSMNQRKQRVELKHSPASAESPEGGASPMRRNPFARASDPIREINDEAKDVFNA